MVDTETQLLHIYLLEKHVLHETGKIPYTHTEVSKLSPLVIQGRALTLTEVGLNLH